MLYNLTLKLSSIYKRYIKRLSLLYILILNILTPANLNAQTDITYNQIVELGENVIVSATNSITLIYPFEVELYCTFSALIIPPTPQNFNHQVLDYKTIRFTWTDILHETSYKIERSTVPGNWTESTLITVSANSTSYTDIVQDLNITTYYYRIYAVNEGGQSGYSNTITVNATEDIFIQAEMYDDHYGTTIVNDVIQFNANAEWIKLEDVNFTDLNIAKLYIQQEMSTDETFLEIRIDSPTGTLIGEVKGRNISNWDEFYINVSAITGTHDVYIKSIKANPEAPTYICQLDWAELYYSEVDIPSDFETERTGSNAIKLTWENLLSSGTGIEIERKIYGEAEYSFLISLDVNTESYVDIGVISGNNYYYRIRKVNNTEYSPYANSNLLMPRYANNAVNTDMNWATSTVYGAGESVIGQSVSYYNDLGKLSQSISRNIESGKIIVNQNLYDAEGRGVLTTLPAVISQVEINYIDNFITDNYSNNYSYSNFDGSKLNYPDPVNTSSPLGYYYSNSNTMEAYVPSAEGYPYSRVEYSKTQPNAVRKSSMAGVQYKMGNSNNNESQFYTVSAPVDELDFILDLFTETLNNTLDANGFAKLQLNENYLIKSVSVDPDGKQSVVYSDNDGNVISTCIVNSDINTSPHTIAVGSNGYIDINDQGRYIYCSQSCQLIDLTNDELIGSPATAHNLSQDRQGVYRVLYEGTSDPTTINVTYKTKYDYYSLNFYDKAGRLVRSMSPKAVKGWLVLSPANRTMENINKISAYYKYNSLGWLLETFSPDEGITQYKYMKDGRIRFSQNAKQRAESTGSVSKFSYTNYSDDGRILEVGEFNGPILFENISTGLINNTYEQGEYGLYSSSIPSQYSSFETFSEYDDPLEDPPISGYVQHYITGKVARTWNDNASTWYSYTYDGKMEWVITEIDDFDPYTVDYEYDQTGNVIRVIYQKNEFTERMDHEYIYDRNNRLMQVYTKNYTEDGDLIEQKLQANYIYYAHGPLKRVEIAEDLQGIDYVYTINGQLKSINQPLLEAYHWDPGQDGVSGGAHAQFAKDLFGMSLDYYNGDYIRTGSNIQSDFPVNYFNGNIAQQRWKNQGLDASMYEEDQNIYRYSYNKRNFLATATYGSYFVFTNTVNLSGNHAFSVFGSSFGNPVTYDANGNILTLGRKDINGTTIDAFNYFYKDDYGQNFFGKNQLNYVDDTEGDKGLGDLGIQTDNNYHYNEIGQLTQNYSDGHYFEYDVYGKVTAIYNDFEHINKLVEYIYDDKGFRIKKLNYSSGTLASTTFYVRDIGGNILAIYTLDNGETEIVLEEMTVYGASRLGIARQETIDEPFKYEYELIDHLGNVRLVFSEDTDADPDSNPDILTAADYYPGGMQMPGRLLTPDNYRFGYQGQFSEKDGETGYNQFEASVKI